MIYCDTSYLVRWYLDDDGFEGVRTLCSQNEVATAAHAQAELPAALHRALREGRVSVAAFAALIAQFEMDRVAGLFHWQPLSADILGSLSSRYAGLPPRVFIRAADAMHLACAAANGFQEIYSNDRHLLAAAPEFGLTGRNVIQP